MEGHEGGRGWRDRREGQERGETHGALSALRHRSSRFVLPSGRAPDGASDQLSFPQVEDLSAGHSALSRVSLRASEDEDEEEGPSEGEDSAGGEVEEDPSAAEGPAVDSAAYHRNPRRGRAETRRRSRANMSSWCDVRGWAAK